MLDGEISLVHIGEGQTMGDCCQSPDEKLRRVKPAGGSGLEGTKLIRAVCGVEESTCRNCEDSRGLSPKQKEVSPSEYQNMFEGEKGQKGFPRNYSSVMGEQAGSWEERKLAEVSTKLN